MILSADAHISPTSDAKIEVYDVPNYPGEPTVKLSSQDGKLIIFLKTREKVIELRDAINAYLGEEPVLSDEESEAVFGSPVTRGEV